MEKINEQYARFEDIVYINSSVIELKLFLPNFKFTPGQHISLSLKEYSREYSIYKYSNNLLTLLIKIIPHGKLTPLLMNLEKGDKIKVGTPKGYFTLDSDSLCSLNKIYFITTGTGIAPVLCLIENHKIENFHIIHGTKGKWDSIPLLDHIESKTVHCFSQENESNHPYRVSKYVEKYIGFDKGYLFFLCGNSQMITDVYYILKEKGFSSKQIFTEEYF